MGQASEHKWLTKSLDKGHDDAAVPLEARARAPMMDKAFLDLIRPRPNYRSPDWRKKPAAAASAASATAPSAAAAEAVETSLQPPNYTIGN